MISFLLLKDQDILYISISINLARALHHTIARYTHTPTSQPVRRHPALWLCNHTPKAHPDKPKLLQDAVLTTIHQSQRAAKHPLLIPSSTSSIFKRLGNRDRWSGPLSSPVIAYLIIRIPPVGRFELTLFDWFLVPFRDVYCNPDQTLTRRPSPFSHPTCE
jgi:hypothetical protein